MMAALSRPLGRLLYGILMAMVFSGCTALQDGWPPNGPAGPRRVTPEAAAPAAPEAGPETVRELETDGDLLLESGNLPMAMVKYHRALEKAPGNADLRYKIGRLLLVGGASDTARRTFLAVIERQPDHARAYQGIGHARFQMENFDEAEAAFNKALSLDDTLWQSNVFLGIIYDYQNDFTRAIWEYRAAIQRQPGKGLLYNNLGVAYAMAGRYEDAVNAYRQATKNGYGLGRVYNNLGVALGKLGAYDRALEAFIKAGGEARAYNNLGCIFLDKGEYGRAIQSFKKAIALKPGFYETANDNLNIARRALAEGATGGAVPTAERKEKGINGL